MHPAPEERARRTIQVILVPSTLLHRSHLFCTQGFFLGPDLKYGVHVRFCALTPTSAYYVVLTLACTVSLEQSAAQTNLWGFTQQHMPSDRESPSLCRSASKRWVSQNWWFTGPSPVARCRHHAVQSSCSRSTSARPPPPPPPRARTVSRRGLSAGLPLPECLSLSVCLPACLSLSLSLSLSFSLSLAPAHTHPPARTHTLASTHFPHQPERGEGRGGRGEGGPKGWGRWAERTRYSRTGPGVVEVDVRATVEIAGSVEHREHEKMEVDA